MENNDTCPSDQGSDEELLYRRLGKIQADSRGHGAGKRLVLTL
jgi:hypothetical protein